MAQVIYKRNQAEEALWAVFAPRYASGRTTPPAFGTRIKRLLEIDRAEPATRAIPHAFSDVPAGKGSDSVFTELNCACLAIGLEMLDIGFKQREIAHFLRTYRDTIREEIDFMFTLGDGHPAKRKAPIAPQKRNKDARLFMIVRKLELPNPAAEGGLLRKAASNAALKPLFGHGLKETSQKLDRLTKSSVANRSCIVIEIGTMIEDLFVHLANIPEKKRGRS